MKTQTLLSLWPFVLLAIGSAAGAQTMYKSILPDGRVVYGEKPEPGATRVETVAPPPAKTGTSVLTPGEKKSLEQRIQERVETADAERRELEAAYKQLKEAEAAREAGKEPLPGERLGTAGGGSRLSDAYWERQKKLEAAVEAARARVKKAEQAARR